MFARADLAVIDARAVALAESGNVAGRSPPAPSHPSSSTLGDVLAGTAPGRRSDDDVTGCQPVGIGLQDLADRRAT